MAYPVCPLPEVELRGRKERERDAAIAAAFHEIAVSAQALGAHPAKVLLPRIEQLCKECRETLEKPLLMDILLTTEWGLVNRYAGDYEGAPFGVVSKDDKLLARVYPREKVISVYKCDDFGEAEETALASEKLCSCDWERAKVVFDRLMRRP